MASSPSIAESAEPIRAELFSVERLERYARTLATSHETSGRHGRLRLISSRLTENGDVLLTSYRELAEAIREEALLTPAAEWLVDNFHVVESQLHEIRENLPSSYYRQLPKLKSGPLAGYPRVFGIAWAYVAHHDSRFDPEALSRFVDAYQEVKPLTIGELWAIPITLRVVMVENLRRMAEDIVAARRLRREADDLADELLGLGGGAPVGPEVIKDRFGSKSLPQPFVVQLIQRLRDHDPESTPGLAWLLARLAADQTTADEVVAQTHDRQAASNVTVRNIVTGLRHISSFEWPGFVEAVSLVDRHLTAGSNFGEVSFATRDQYRHAIEDLARASDATELEVAEATLRLTGAYPPDRRQGDPGYYLLAEGRPKLETELGFRSGLGLSLARMLRRRAAPAYLATLALVTALAMSLPMLTMETSSRWIWLIGILALIPASDLAVTVVNRVVTAVVHPQGLPALDFRHGPTKEFRTMVVIPAMLSSPAQVERLVERLEVHYLANPEGEFHFALLTDWRDSDEPETPGDGEILAVAADGIDALNHRYGSGPGGSERFLHLHRRRQFNPGEGRYMGWERKRGKLHELNRLLRGATDTSYLPWSGQLPREVRYVITLDEDSRLPPGAGSRLVETIAHPLNRARIDEAMGRVVEGYGVLQPRVTAFLGAGGTSFFQRVFFPPAGIDPYAAAISDVYQDLFGEGSYAGKGIYEIDSFEAALDSRVPENTILSHDLFEGSFARAGLVTNVEVFEEFPSHYEVALSRQHRWVRGDWQLLPWILGRHGPLPLVARIKMVDNLRRSLFNPAALFILIAAFVVPGEPVWPWIAFVTVAMILPALLPLIERMFPRRTTTPGAVRLRRWRIDLARTLGRLLLQIAFLAHQALRTTEAIVITLGRLAVTRRNLLNWVTAGEDERNSGLDRRAFVRRMGPSMVVAVAATTAAAVAKPEALAVALAFSSLWVAAPLIAQWASVPRQVSVADIPTPAEIETLRLTARRTWRYFERFVTAEDNWLPPDNFQEDVDVVAHRTSPTNIGLYLLSVVSAREFGWIGTEDAVARLESTLATLDELERYRGHFLNWYETTSLEPLAPRYISSVDSGNLAGHLMAVSEGCIRLQRLEPGTEIIGAVRDTAGLVREAAARLDKLDAENVSPRDLDIALDSLLDPLGHPSGPGSPGRWDEIELAAEVVADVARTLAVGNPGGDLEYWAEALLVTVRSHRADRQVFDQPERTKGLEDRLAEVAKRTADLAHSMDFSFLLDPDNKLLTVGYRVFESALDGSHYDLLASEARLASFVGISKGDLSPSHWFRLGRPMTPMGTEAALISWSGSMFEYLMPLLVMESPPESVLSTTYRAVLQRQIEYGRERQVPWGISESAYAARDAQLTYQYRAFGVPGLGFERGLSEDLVVAPYATLLGAMLDPAEAVVNLARLDGLGALGTYGYYEALDFTPARRPDSGDPVLVEAYMAHHQAMSLVSVANVVFDGFARRLFHGEPSVRAAELLLHERVPRDLEVARPRAEEVAATARPVESAEGAVRRVTSPHGPVPVAHLLSNGRFSTVVTSAGSGYSRWHGLAVNRWREDVTRDNYGSYLFIRDESGRAWSAGYQPTRAEPGSYEVAFSEDKVEISRRDGSIATQLTVVISAEDDAEVRRLSLTNLGPVARELEVTSYAELVLAHPRSDDAHPAFSNLFVQTEAVFGRDALLASRRVRSAEEETIWAGHVLAVTGEVVGGAQYETDRSRFLGRGNPIHRAAAIDRPLSNSVGRVLDPIFSLRRKVRIPPGQTAHLDFITLIAESRSHAIDLIDKFSDPDSFERSTTLAWSQAQVRLNHLRINPAQAHVFQELAGSLIYSDPARRTVAARTGATISRDSLWRHSISGDLPIVLVRIDRNEERGLVRDLLRAQEYWRIKGLFADLVIVNEKPGSYAHDLQDLIEELIRERGRTVGQAPDGGVFVVNGPLLSDDDRATLIAASRVILLSHHGTLADQLARRPAAESKPVMGVPPVVATQATATPPREKLEFPNGLGGFSGDGSEYTVVLGEGQWTPVPWVNVVANPRFGFCVSASGSSFSWSENSRENQLTPWSNDPVTDPPGEVIYVRDVETGEVWTPTALPIRDQESFYVARHGAGFSSFEHVSRGISLRLHQTVPLEDPVKMSRLRIRNQTGRRRRISVTGYVEWVLGTTREVPTMHVVTGRDESTGAVIARNPWNLDFAHRVAFADFGDGDTTMTTDRTEFLGRHGSVDKPAALQGAEKLSGRVGAGFDPCGAIQRMVVLDPGEEVELLFLLGQGDDESDARRLIEKYRESSCESIAAEVAARWTDVSKTVQVRTPDRSFDLMVNHWLLYQALACRVLARAAFYQAGGAYGFRDQLQDVMALVVPKRSVAREHLLRAAAHQFEEGDVLHWWHETSGKGVRTRISDDYLWLPYAVAHYVEVTGDEEILTVEVPFIRGPELEPGQDEVFIAPEPSGARGTLFEHCQRALDRAVSRLGSRGLPLIGTGDWNDGFNRVGREGEGESVWLGWFLDANLKRFAEIADGMDRGDLASRWREAAKGIRGSIEAEAWDGDWYRRAFFDDGTPLGSTDSPECRIDSIAQSWAVIHGGGNEDRSRRAMASVEEYLVRSGDGLVLLFTPPFDDWDVDPGYIKGYLPGIRENGGQYTHAAIWSVIAFATLGDGDRAGELFGLLNPINHSRTRAGIHRYRVEPYVAAADVYSEHPHVGRGGWTWYTGAAGWMYRAGVEWILGFRLRGTRLVIDPCIPRDWRTFEITFKYHSSTYEIQVNNPSGATKGVVGLSVDGISLSPGSDVDLLDDGATHQVEVVLG